MFKMIAFLLVGISIGISIKDQMAKRLMKSKEDLIKTYKELVSEQDKNIKLYDEYVRLLEDEYIKVYENALNDTLRENIGLKKKLKAYE